MKSKSFEDVELWRKAHAWVLAVYRFTARFPKHELFGLTSQLRRAAVSVAANFAEGFKESSRADKIRIYNIAQGSLEECRYFLILARDLRYGDSVALMMALEEIRRMLEGYIRAIGMHRAIDYCLPATVY